MIVSMKKIAVVMRDSQALPALEALRSLGAVHIEHQQPPQGIDLNAIQDDITLLDSAIGILSEPAFVKVAGSQSDNLAQDWKFVAKHIVDLDRRLDQLSEYLIGLRSRIGQWEKWGDFNPGEIQQLAQQGLYIKLYQIPQKDVDKLPGAVIVKKIFASAGFVHCVVVSRQKIDINFKEIALPKLGLQKMKERLYEDGRMMQIIKDDICKYIAYRQDLIRERGILNKELEFARALKGMGQADQLKYLVGYVPSDDENLIRDTAKTQGWGLLINDPAEDDTVPTLIRNPRWVSIINPVFKMIEVIPGYNELDISFWFLIFFSIFFGMLIGDAGYGAAYFLLTLFAHKKLGVKVKDNSVFILFYILSGCAILWGVLTATFFGQEWLPQSIKPIIPALRNDKNIQSLCFFLGALHLSIAHLWRFINKMPSLAALADAGWILILWFAFFLARLLILGDNLVWFASWLLIAGVCLVIFFSHPSKNILKSLGRGLGTLLLSLVNNFTDIVSYIRLFAVGLATVAVADAFNNMAIGVGFNSIFSGLMASFIIVVGHLLNILLGPLTILVHGVRLNVLEFCSHLDIKWSGFVYRPFQDKAVN